MTEIVVRDGDNEVALPLPDQGAERDALLANPESLGQLVAGAVRLVVLKPAT